MNNKVNQPVSDKVIKVIRDLVLIVLDKERIRDANQNGDEFLGVTRILRSNRATAYNIAHRGHVSVA